MSQSICRHFMLQIALKCADISNPCRNWNISRLWSYRACEEFYRQGDRERELELPITPICDRSNISVAKVSLSPYNLHYQSSWIRDGSYNYFIFVYRFNRHFIVMLHPLFLKSGIDAWTLHCPQIWLTIWPPIKQDGTWSFNKKQGLQWQNPWWAHPHPLAEEDHFSVNQEEIHWSLQHLIIGTFKNQDEQFIILETLMIIPLFCRLSRSSGEGDEDSDPCCSYPYMPLDSHPEDTLTSPRRHSLPPFLSDPLFRLYTSMTSTSEELPANFQRQMSLVDGSRRRFSAVQELRRQNAELLANLKLSQKRRVFAGKKLFTVNLSFLSF